MVSTGGCDEDPDIGEMAQSIAPAPARTASTYVAMAMPLVQCACNWMGTAISLISALMSRSAEIGDRMPAMSLMTSESIPIWTCSFATRTNSATVCTGLIV